MAIKKSQLYSSLWQSCDELRGGMDASQYKDYVLTLLFMKYVSDKKDSLIEVPEGGSFADMVALKGDKEIGDKINKIIGRLAEANDLKGVIDQADFNEETKLGSGKDMQDRLSKLVGIFDQLDLGANRADGDDLLGDAYEYLMRHFATESGKSKGQFYTPGEVSRVIAQVVGIGPDTLQDETLYDPACGSGSLLLRAAYEAPQGMSIYGQENDNATWALAKMNMILHDYPTAEIWQDNTLSRPYFKNASHSDEGSLKTFDYAVANPPFSAKSWTNGLDPVNDEFGRFEYGIPPAKNGDYAFLLHFIKSLKSTGKGAIILPHGVLFRGHKEADIRRNLIQRGLIKGIIGLPANLFYGTGIPACILVIDKEHANSREHIFMCDASREFIKDGNKNRLRSRDIHKIVDVFNHQRELPGYARRVPLAEIASEANNYNLNIPRYIDAGEAEDQHDLSAHLKGGIPERDVDALEPYWSVLPGLRKALFRDSDRAGYLEAKVETQEVKPTVLDHAAFMAFAERVSGVTDDWQTAHRSDLWALQAGDKPRKVIYGLSEDLLQRFTDVPLLDRYAVYQRLMDYWADVMQDDVYLIAAENWVEASRPRGVIENKERKIKEEPDLTVGRGKKAKKYKLDLIPPELVIARYFEDQTNEIEALKTNVEELQRQLEEMEEEYGDEDAPLFEIRDGNKKPTKTDVEDRLSSYEALLLESCRPDVVQGLRDAQKELEDNEAERKAIEEDPGHVPYVSPLLGKQGKVTKKNLKDQLKRLSETESVERNVLQNLFDAIEAVAGAKKTLTQKQKTAKQTVEELVNSDNDVPEVKDVIVLRRYLSLTTEIPTAESRLKDAQAELDQAVLARYFDLTEDEIKQLAVDDKWLADIRAATESEVERITNQLAGRVRELEERYAEPLPSIEREVEALAAKVTGHLEKMGVRVDG
ncbi:MULTISPECIES: type I restriction-modification system subunit M [unclassified Salinivibrio]|uniref:type I restriction-modification system subunit M n=1 Tax=unclassified Salinivibrio TaxID=2636825 RepID=UPI00128B5C27|nr:MULTISPECIES: type I restriction-modification system subunit M [unclassified Salinivibrio]MPS32628.1 type I restriction-modification system subunit M [Salinivibrio sp. VYel7]MPX94019.1 type I restriction-modification system subunit M [Salinivibrio sp. VYel9]MPY00121.1 type I restriction-modification system subunit M [Salinivibrio sp. VYel4]MPY03189.1 type I restriction-modification system subunit M [Salinivibrio sp. VYel5]